MLRPALLALLFPSAAAASLAARLHNSDFFEHSWGREVAHLRADDASAFDALASAASPAYLADLLRDDAARGAVTARVAGEVVPKDGEAVEPFLARGGSYVVKYEKVPALFSDARAAGLALVWADVADALVAPATLHLYRSGPAGVALAPHTDTGDVLVLQIDGRMHTLQAVHGMYELLSVSDWPPDESRSLCLTLIGRNLRAWQPSITATLQACRGGSAHADASLIER